MDRQLTGLWRIRHMIRSSTTQEHLNGCLRAWNNWIPYIERNGYLHWPSLGVVEAIGMDWMEAVDRINKKQVPCQCSNCGKTFERSYPIRRRVEFIEYDCCWFCSGDAAITFREYYSNHVEKPMREHTYQCARIESNPNMGKEMYFDPRGVIFLIESGMDIREGDEVKCERDENGSYQRVWVNGELKLDKTKPQS